MAVEKLGFIEDSTVSYDGLQNGRFPYKEKAVTLLSGEVRLRGDVMGIVTASGKVILSLVGAGDGSEVIKGIMGKDTDATAGDIKTFMYVAGGFAKSKVNISDHTFNEALEELLRQRSIYLDLDVKTDGTTAT